MTSLSTDVLFSLRNRHSQEVKISYFFLLLSVNTCSLLCMLHIYKMSLDREITGRSLV